MIRLRIAEVAEQLGLNQSQLQLRSGVTAPLLNRYWNNNTDSVTFAPLEKIAAALGVEPGELLMTSPESEQPTRVQERYGFKALGPGRAQAVITRRESGFVQHGAKECTEGQFTAYQQACALVERNYPGDAEQASQLLEEQFATVFVTDGR